MKIRINNSDRVAFIGTTGSGKTQLAKFFLSYLNRVVVIDPKHTFRLDGFKRTWNLPAFSKHFKLIVRPKLSEDGRLFDFLRKIYKTGNITIYCDEMATLSEMFPASTIMLADIARTGRERRVALWSAMQRPRGTPKVFLTEAETFFVFNLRSLDDRQYVKGYAGDEVQDKIEKFYFWHVRLEDDSPNLLTLNLKNNRIESLERSQT
jgi:DNA helicase HerA-like ATPase